MRGNGRIAGGLGTQFALRTYLLFCLCSLLPVAIFGAIGYSVVSRELSAAADQRLAEASKHYGLLLNDRLIQAERALADIAWANVPTQNRIVAAPSDTRIHNVVVKERAVVGEPVPGSASEPLVTPSLSISGADPPVIHMQVTLQSGVRSIVASADLLPSDLWDADAVMLAGMKLCASAQKRQLICMSADSHLESADTSDSNLSQRWSLYLRPRYGVDEWIIEASQPRSLALGGLRTFQRTLLGAALVACFAALLLSAIQIRRSHRPLADLVNAARLLGASRFDTRVRLKGGDEFAQLGRAFNRLASGLQHQFRMLRALSRIDRLILARPEVELVVRAILPRIARVLRAEGVIVAFQDREATHVTVYFCGGEQSAAIDVHRIDGASMAAAIGRHPAHWLDQRQLSGSRDLTWRSSPIVVNGMLRGEIATAHISADAAQRGRARHLQGLARRFAVALANEDRERALLHQAYYDSLTTLPNRQLFKDRLEQELQRSKRSGTNVVLFYIDLDHFKNVNDSLGHSAGDELLRAAAARLLGLLKAGDTIARLGGDEFTMIAPATSDAAAASIARSVIESLSRPFQLDAMQCTVQASIGIAVFPRDADDAEALLRNADTAMYRAKSQGRGRAVFFEEVMNTRAVRRLALEQRLRLAISQEALSLNFQPKFATSDRRLLGVEALARWTDSTLGSISPAEFIPLAEECGLIEALGTWALREACRAMRHWRDKGLQIGHVAVNVSMAQLRNQDFPELVRAVLAEFRLNPGDLEIEVTESMLAGELREVVRLLDRIRSLGVRIAIDDFGTGYSSMVALQQLPADVVKIDRAFVTSSHQPEGLALLRALIAAGHALGKEVVAEGVETEGQLQTLRSCLCDVVQGYLLGRPCAAAEFESRYAPVDTCLPPAVSQ